ncbi:MAG: hypothetical protein KJS92_06910, partial [Bacteroidetes bacterium]|nr:hypothetical protein [Bacteroidota bacterium]
MRSAFKLLLLCLLSLLPEAGRSQVSISLNIKPPFTPFISDYTNPLRLQDISLALFNTSADKLRLKFRFTLKNQAKGIEISLKESANPVNPLELLPNEFRFVQMDEIGNLYSGLTQNSFNISGVNIQNLILDGTIPDGTYDICLQAFDYDAVGFSKPLSNSAPAGCFSFQVNYTDPPTDIRFNSNLLQYNFGGKVPQIGINGLTGQNYTIQFTPPAFTPGGNFEYELMVFSEDMVNPTRQQERSLMEAISSITPLIRKTSNV